MGHKCCCHVQASFLCYSVPHMNKKRTNLLLGIIAIIIFVAIAGFVRERFLAAQVVLVNVDDEATVFINGKARRTINTDGTITISLPIGTQEVGIDRDGYWPWVKTISLNTGDEYIFAPFIVSRAALAEGVRTSDPNFTTIRSLFVSESIPNPTNPLVSSDELSRIWLDGEEIIFAWDGPATTTPQFLCTPGCVAQQVITQVATAPRSLTFLPDRNDVIVLATLDGVFALEVDSRGIQNFQRIYKGDLPQVVSHDHNLYVLDNDRLLKLLFE